jgi:anti-sigma regulatory factor (Ser/Thr protein kinase)
VITSSLHTIALLINDISMIGEGRRTATAFAARLGFDETERGKVGIIATEITTNLIKHAGGGELILRELNSSQGQGLEMLALDKGPGMSDIDRCMKDGFSTAGSPGNGLGAIERMSSFFDIYSQAGIGTGLLAQFWRGTPRLLHPEEGMIVGVVNLAVAGEEVCGDAWAIKDQGGAHSLILVADGLGHGFLAAEASREAVRIFGERDLPESTDAIHAIHSGLRSTRGAALAIAKVDRELGEVRFAGVGNISGVILNPVTGRGTSMVSHNGTVGHTLWKVQEFKYPWSSNSTLLLHSDGLGTHWHLERYPGLMARHPALLAGILYRDFRRSRDDVTVLVVRERDKP